MTVISEPETGKRQAWSIEIIWCWNAKITGAKKQSIWRQLIIQGNRWT